MALTIGTVLKCSTAGTTTFGVTIGGIRNLTLSGVSADDVEIQTLDQAPNKTFTPGWLDAGEFAITVLYAAGTTTNGHAVMNSLFKNRVTPKWQVSHSSSSILPNEEFDAYIKGIGREYPLDGFVAQDYTFKVTGASGLST